MASKHDETYDLSKPALILVHGNAVKKHRPLDQDAIVIGRARCSDLGLEAPDVSSVHSVITRRPDGFRIRDCGSRSGTRVNGSKIRDERLEDGDLLQVGPFSFRVHLPGGTGNVQPRTAADERLIQRLERARKNLTRLALRQRQVVRQLLEQQAPAVAALPTEYQEQSSALCARVRDYEQRVRLLEEGERDLSRDRELLRQEQQTVQQNVRRFDEELVERRTALEAEAAALRRQPGAMPANAGTAELDRAAHDLGQQRVRLALERERLTQWQEELTRRFQQLQSEHREIISMREDWLAAQAEVGARLQRQSAAITEAELALREQRASIAAMVADLDRLYADAREHEGGQAGQLRQENEQLQQALEAALRQRDEELSSLRQDQELLVKTLQENERKHHAEVQRLQKSQEDQRATSLTHRVHEEQLSALRGEVELLRQLLQEKDALLAEVQAQPERSGQMDMDTYEEELNQYRRQLDADRARLNQEITHLRERNAEMDEATRELEMEMARERAELARERTRMERMREEIRHDTERGNRDGGMRDRLAPVQKLREEMNGKQADEAALNGRLRNLRPKG